MESFYGSTHASFSYPPPLSLSPSASHTNTRVPPPTTVPSIQKHERIFGIWSLIPLHKSAAAAVGLGIFDDKFLLWRGRSISISLFGQSQTPNDKDF
ncbi:unnamed protein product [Camellia sinensis]